MSGSTGGAAPAASGGQDANIAKMQAAMAEAEQRQADMFVMSTKENEQNTEISTWGNLAEGIAKNKPQV